jgi:hypothetical protein
VVAYFVLGLGLLAGTLLLLKWFTEADPKRIGRGLLWVVGLIALVLGVVLLWLGRYYLAWIALPALYALAGRWREIWRAIKRFGGGGGGAADERSSTVETAYLRMTLMHDSGVMTGEVLAGQFAGRRLEDLSLSEAVALWHEVGADEQSRQVLESYLDRIHGADWREAATAGGRASGGGGSGTGGAMTAEEARAVLGVGADADAETIRAAYRRLMKQVHPDHGGSDYFAMKLNEARRVLLGE